MIVLCEIICNCLVSRWPRVIYCNISSDIPCRQWKKTNRFVLKTILREMNALWWRKKGIIGNKLQLPANDSENFPYSIHCITQIYVCMEMTLQMSTRLLAKFLRARAYLIQCYHNLVKWYDDLIATHFFSVIIELCFTLFIRLLYEINQTSL